MQLVHGNDYNECDECAGCVFFFSSRRRHTRSVSAFLLNRSSDLPVKAAELFAYTQGKREQFSGFNRTLDAINNVFRKFSAFHDETGRLNEIGRASCRERV